MEELVRQLFDAYPVLGTVLGGLLAAHALASFVVNLTPTPEDDRWLGRAYRVIEWVAGVTDTAKTLPGEDRQSVKASKEVNRRMKSRSNR
jgi:hypothetical protein